VICSAWNHLALQRYIILFARGESRMVEIFVDGNVLKMVKEFWVK
jgi:hypothetical protein